MANVITFCGFLPHDTHWSDRLVYVTEHNGETWVIRQWPHALADFLADYRHGNLLAWGLIEWSSWAPIDKMESIDAKAAALARDIRDVPF